MKNLIKLTLLSASFVITTSLFAQDGQKKQAHKKGTAQNGAKKTTKEATKADAPAPGGTRMAITEQGTPKKRKAAPAAAPAPATPAKK